MKTHYLYALKAAVLSTLLILASTTIAQAAGSCASTCNVKNENTDTSYTDLQVAIAAASSGDTLVIQGLCQGSFTITNIDLTLRGKSKGNCPAATLQCNVGGSATLTINATASNTVSLIDLLITGGTNSGIINNNSTLNLYGTTAVSGNSSSSPINGGGITNNSGTVNMYNKSQVSGNTAINGGGVLNSDTATTVSTFNMYNAATVKNNTATNLGGGIANGALFSSASVTLNNNSNVSGNTANAGGGIFNIAATAASASVTLNNNARINNNSAVNLGGGVNNNANSTLTMTGNSLIDTNAALSGGGISNSGTLIGTVEGVNVKNNTPDDIAP